MTIGELKELIPLLRANAASFFKNGEIEISFQYKEPTRDGLSAWLPDEKTVPLSSADDPNAGIKTEIVNDTVVPQSIEEESGTGLTAEAILNWSVDSDVKDPLCGMNIDDKSAAKGEDNG